MDDMSAYYPPPPPLPPPPSTYYHHPPLPQQPLPPPPPPVVLHHHHLPPPPTSSYSHSLSSHSSSHDGEVRTLFVAGFPDDVSPREIYNLFREFPGYLSSNLRSPSKNHQPFAFAVFTDQQSAVSAMHALNGMVFDLEKGSTLFIDLAKSNSRSKRQRTDDEGPRIDKKHKGSPVSARGTYELGVGSFHISGVSSSAYDTIGYPPAQSHLSYDSRGIRETNTANVSHSSGSHAPQNNPPCPTIFVANLGPNCTEQELIQVFSRCRGFLKLKIQGRNGAPVAFVDFQDTTSSTEALNRLQGIVLISSPMGEGMRLEYAKSRMGMRRKRK